MSYKEKQKSNPSGLYGKYLLHKMNKGHESFFDYGLSFINIKPYHHILDIGCGNGYVTSKLLDMVPEGIVYAIDISKTCIKDATKLNKRAIESNKCDIRLENVLDLTLSDGSIDLALALCTIRFWSDYPIAFTNIYKVLKKGGTFLIVDKGRYDINMVEMDLYMAGFNKVSINKSEEGIVCIVAFK